MDLRILFREKYLNYFGAKNCKKEDELFNLFLTDISNLSESKELKNIVPTVIIKNIFNKLGIKKDFSIQLVETIKIANELSNLEIFSLLWYCSCKNVLTYNENFYLMQANNGNIFELLNVLSKRTF